MKNKIALTLISFLANFIMAGFASQFGMLIEPIAVRYSADVNTVASIFSLLNGGALAGTIAAFFLIEKIDSVPLFAGNALKPRLMASDGCYDFGGLLRWDWSVCGRNDCRFGMAGSHSKYNVGGTRRHL